jgi:hypothetical protein
MFSSNSSSITFSHLILLVLILLSSNKSCGLLHLWPTINLSSQLKHKLWAFFFFFSCQMLHRGYCIRSC